jgi:hypothetical protein
MMPDLIPDLTPDLTIDRLVLELPGFDAQRAARLAACIGEALAGGLAPRPAQHAMLSATIDPDAGETDAQLAARIATLLLQRIG